MQDVRVIATLDELDEMLRKLDKAAEISDDELRKQFRTFRMEFDTRVPEDPYSQEYRDRQFELYARIAGKNYSISNEVSAFDIDNAAVRPFPYYTESCETVGYHLMAVANTIRLLKLRKGSRIVEFGPGWGNTTLALAMMGFEVTAVDIEKNFCELVSKRAKQQGVSVNVVNADFSWIEQVGEPVDAILFFESFHHASDHLALLKALSNATKRDGRVYFAAEPIVPDFPIQWGLRLDGESLWAIRKNGWLELGFKEDYFVRTLDLLGWVVEKHVSDATPWGTVFEARKKEGLREQIKVIDRRIRTQIGVKTDEGVLRSSGNRGFVMYGPYISLPAGRYVARIHLLPGKRMSGRGVCDVCFRSGKVIVTSIDVNLSELYRPSIELLFELSERQGDVEIRVFCDDRSLLEITGLEILPA